MEGIFYNEKYIFATIIILTAASTIAQAGVPLNSLQGAGGIAIQSFGISRWPE